MMLGAIFLFFRKFVENNIDTDKIKGYYIYKEIDNYYQLVSKNVLF